MTEEYLKALSDMRELTETRNRLNTKLVQYKLAHEKNFKKMGKHLDVQFRKLLNNDNYFISDRDVQKREYIEGERMALEEEIKSVKKSLALLEKQIADVDYYLQFGYRANDPRLFQMAQELEKLKYGSVSKGHGGSGNNGGGSGGGARLSNIYAAKNKIQPTQAAPSRVQYNDRAVNRDSQDDDEEEELLDLIESMKMPSDSRNGGLNSRYISGSGSSSALRLTRSVPINIKEDPEILELIESMRMPSDSNASQNKVDPESVHDQLKKRLEALRRK